MNDDLIAIIGVGSQKYGLPNEPGDVVLSYSIGLAFKEMQQLEYEIISFLLSIANSNFNERISESVMATKTFGNLIKEMEKHEIFHDFLIQIKHTKERRDFFIHKFLFDRYGGPSLTNSDEYNLLINEAMALRGYFAECRQNFIDLMIYKSDLTMVAFRCDPDTGDITLIKSNAMKKEE